jgi:hypothetical protein
MAMLFLGGEKFNLVGRATTLSSSPAAEVLANPLVDPLVYLGQDNQPSAPVVFSAIQADSYFQVDLSEVLNGGFETSTLASWTDADVAAGTSTETTTAGEFNSGAKALECTGTSGSDVGRRYQDIRVRAGELRKLHVFIRAASGTGDVYLQNLSTGKYLQSGLTWSTSRNPVLTHNTSTYTEKTATYQVESLDACQADLVYLRLYLESSVGAANVQFDDVADYGGVNFGSVHGHNIDQAVTMTLVSDDNSGFSSGTTRATFTVKRGAFFSSFATIYERYWRLKFGGQNLVSAPYVGEWVLGQATSMSIGARYGSSIESIFPQLRHQTAGGEQWRFNITSDAVRRFSLSLSLLTTSAGWLQGRDEFWRRTGGGLWPAVIVPIDTEPDVFYGIFPESMTIGRTTMQVQEPASLLFEELPFPVVGL